MSIKISAKVHPVGLNEEEEAQIAKLGALVSPAFQYKPSFKPKRGRSVDFSSKSGSVSGTDSRKNISSFISNVSDMEEDTGVTLELVINFLTLNVEEMIKDTVLRKEFEDLCQEMMKGTKDPELQRILKSHGWTGTRFKTSTVSPLDIHALLQDLSNIYLRSKVSVYTLRIANNLAENEKVSDQIFSFVPDSLLSYLSRPEVSLSRGGTMPHLNLTPGTSTVTALAVSGSTVNGNGPIPEGGSGSFEESTTPAPAVRLLTQKSSVSSKSSIGIEPGGLVMSSEVRSATFTGACMLADISGFSKFSGAMCLKGVNGLDELREATNGFLGHIVKIVYEFHGDVVAFAGDALICVFLDQQDDEITTGENSPSPGAGGGSSPSRPNNNNNNNSKRSDEMRQINCCYRALQCASILKNHKTSSLSAHIGVSYGEMKMALLGGLNDQWVYLLNGECVSQLASCIEGAGSQEVAATLACYEKALEFIPPEEPEEDSLNTPQYKSLMGGMKKNNKKIDLTVLEESPLNASEDTEPQPLIRVHTVADPTIVLVDHIDPRIFHKAPTNYFRRTDSHLTSKAKSSRTMRTDEICKNGVLERAAQFVPRPILTAVYSEALDHIGELRHVTTMFVSLDSYSHELNSDPCTLQPFFLMAQRILQETGGFLRQFLVDDKGCVFIAMWGMPSFTYSNNAARALHCGVAILKGVPALGHSCSIGISTGNVFCGTVGAPERRDYAGIGTDVNMAARLMGKAKGRVLLDVKTYQNLNEKTRKLLVAAEEMKLKGSDAPVTPYKYNHESIPAMEGAEEHHDHAILRRPVKTLLGIQIDKISNHHDVNGNAGSEVSHKRLAYFTLVIGPPGTGKSTAVEYFRHSARKRNVTCVFIKARPGHEGVPYGLMRELFLDLVGEDNFSTEPQQRALVMGLLEGAYAGRPIEERRKALFSLEIVLGVDWGKSTRKVGSFTNVVMDAVNSSKKVRAYNEQKEHAAMAGGLGLGLTNVLETTPEEENHKEADLSPNNLSDKIVPGFENMLYDSSMTHLRLPGDLSFYNILHVLLRNRRIAIIIEDAHFCDELSWAELNLILNGKELDVSVLLTMRSNNIKSSSNNNNGVGHSSFATSTAGSFSVHSKSQSQADMSNLSISNLNSALSNANNNNINNNTNNNTSSNPAAGIASVPSRDSLNGDSSNNNSNNNSSSNNNNRNGGTDTPNRNGHRNSVLVSAISVSRAVSIDASAPQLAGQQIPGQLQIPGQVLQNKPYAGNNSPAHSHHSHHSHSSHNPNNRSPTNRGAAEGEVGAVRYGLKAQSSPALVSILNHERATVIEMTGLGEAEVREVLLHTLKVDNVSHDLVRIVYDVSSGNAYWCKAIANFIKERGVKELEDAIQKGDSPHNALKVLILLRMEKLDVDQQLVLKNAAIIGDEFSERMLNHVLPARIRSTLNESVELLAEHGFIFCVEEHPEAIFAFQNELIRETLYELMPPRDSAHIHLQVAQFIEKEYAGNLRPFYPLLGAHYSKSLGNRGLAFKYEIKAADQAISRGAFSDGLFFLEAAQKMAVTKPELKVLSDVIARALRDIAPPTTGGNNAKISATVRKVTNMSFRGAATSAADPRHGKQQAYLNMQGRTQAQLDKFAQNNANNVLGGKGPGDVRLTWQPSYVASRMGENSDGSDEETPRGGRRKATPNEQEDCCSIS